MSSYSKLTKHLITKGWNKQFMKLSQATGSTSNVNKSKLLTLKFRKKEFLVESVQYLILKLFIFANTIVLMSQNHRIVKSSSYFWRWIHQEKCRTVSTLINQLTGANFVFFLFRFNNILSGMIILKNDVIAILNEKLNSMSARKGRSSTFTPGPDKQMKWAI